MGVVYQGALTSMKTERLILSFIAVTVGILAAGVAFYFYQSAKTIPTSNLKTVSLVPPASPTIKPTIFLVVDNPKDEEVVGKLALTVSGKTTPDAAIIITTQSTDQVVTPTANGSFSATVAIEDGANQIEIVAVAVSGEEARVIRTVTYSLENF